MWLVIPTRAAGPQERINEEILVLKNMGVAEDILTLKIIIDKVKQELGYLAEPSKQ